MAEPIIFAQEIELKCWPHIKAAGLCYDNIFPTKASVMSVPFAQSHQDTLSVLEAEVSDIFQTPMRLISGLLFKSKPQANPVIHCDNYNDRFPTDISLNVPIYNTEGSYMEWYEGDHIPYLMYSDATKTVKHVMLQWQEEPRLVHREQILRPSLVRIDMPHRAVNPQDKYRMMMSLRFSSPLHFLPQ